MVAGFGLIAFIGVKIYFFCVSHKIEAELLFFRIKEGIFDCMLFMDALNTKTTLIVLFERLRD